jgi:hypothetical protein
LTFFVQGSDYGSGELGVAQQLRPLGRFDALLVVVLPPPLQPRREPAVRVPNVLGSRGDPPPPTGE